MNVQNTLKWKIAWKLCQFAAWLVHADSVELSAVGKPIIIKPGEQR